MEKSKKSPKLEKAESDPINNHQISLNPNDISQNYNPYLAPDASQNNNNKIPCEKSLISPVSMTTLQPLGSIPNTLVSGTNSTILPMLGTNDINYNGTIVDQSANQLNHLTYGVAEPNAQLPQTLQVGNNLIDPTMSSSSVANNLNVAGNQLLTNTTNVMPDVLSPKASLPSENQIQNQQNLLNQQIPTSINGINGINGINNLGNPIQNLGLTNALMTQMTQLGAMNPYMNPNLLGCPSIPNPYLQHPNLALKHFKNQHQNNNALNNYSKPPYSYSCLIALALRDAPRRQLKVGDIYIWIETVFPWYKKAPQAWRNSVRHNLSLNKSFEKVPDENAPSAGLGVVSKYLFIYLA